MAGLPILSIVTFLPMVGALLILVMRGSDQSARNIALVFTTIDFLLTLVLWAKFDYGTAAFQFVESANWLGPNIGYKMGVDGISVLFVVLTGLLMPLCILASEAVHKRVREYMIAFLVLETLMIEIGRAHV